MNKDKVLQESLALFESLKKEYNNKKSDLEACLRLLSQLKVKLTELSFLQTSTGTQPDVKEALLAREVLELGAYCSIRAKDIASFERYVSQLRIYYFDYASLLPPSQRMYPILGLNLLCLLSQSRIAEFHTHLEWIDPDQLHANIYIKHPVQLEQCLMEGSYNKVYRARSDVPAEEYLFFMDILMATIRHEIANCCEKAYTSLLLSDAATLLHFTNAADVTPFVQQRGWKVQASDKRIVFESDTQELAQVPSQRMIGQLLDYARELERIV